MKQTVVCILLLSLLLLSACAGAPPKVEVSSDTLFVKAIPSLPKDFILGMDVSSVLAEEASGVKYYDFAGQERDLFEILAENGVTHIRVRVWNHPYDAEGRGYGGGNNDAAAAAEIGRRAAKAGLKLIVDFHYSDFWADPGKQMVPLEWKDLNIEAKSEALYAFTRDSLKQIRAAGARIDVVQIGNETNGALCGEKIWFNIQSLMQAGAKAVREVCPKALVAVHFANPENAEAYASYASKLDYYSVDYDVFASSYYPYWHGTLENLSAVLGSIAGTYGKKVMVVETSYAYTDEDTDFSGNTIGAGGGVSKPWPYTVQGQANALQAVAETVAGIPNGIGVCYWEGAWISVGQSSWEENSAKWEKYGSGWASSYAAAYDPEDAGKWYGGCAVDNQAFFGPDGHPLESLKVFGLLRSGNEVELRADAVEDVELAVDLNGTIELPGTVKAVMSDNSRREVPVVWDIDEARTAEMYAGGPAKYEILGEAEGLTAHCFLSMVEFNFLSNAGFESGEAAPWVLTDLGSTEQLYVEDKATDSCEGTKHLHFWSAAKNSVAFTAEQTVEGLKPGAYKFSVSIMGGDGGETEIYAYVKRDGEIVAEAPMKLSGYGNWCVGAVEGVELAEGQSLTVGIYVRCEGEGNGAWGKIDEAMLNSMG